MVGLEVERRRTADVVDCEVEGTVCAGDACELGEDVGGRVVDDVGGAEGADEGGIAGGAGCCYAGAEGGGDLDAYGVLLA